MTMEVADKSVATDDELCYPLAAHNTRLEVARLEAVLNTLVEHKVEAIKNNERLAGVHLSPKTLARRLRLTSTSTASSKEKDSGSHSMTSNRKHRRRKREEERKKAARRTNVSGRGKQRISSSSPESARYSMGKGCERTPPLSDDDAFLHYDPAAAASCCCGEDVVEVINPAPKYDEDYVSLKIEELDEEEDEDEEEREARRRARRKRRRRRRRKRRMKAALATVAVVEDVKVLDPDELPPRARWTIVATACLLLFMCLMLVGVTLRMAPLIDDMVRKENEELMHSLHGDSMGNPITAPPPQNTSPPTVAV